MKQAVLLQVDELRSHHFSQKWWAKNQHCCGTCSSDAKNIPPFRTISLVPDNKFFLSFLKTWSASSKWEVFLQLIMPDFSSCVFFPRFDELPLTFQNLTVSFFHLATIFLGVHVPPPTSRQIFVQENSIRKNILRKRYIEMILSRNRGGEFH